MVIVGELSQAKRISLVRFHGILAGQEEDREMRDPLAKTDLSRDVKVYIFTTHCPTNNLNLGIKTHGQD